MADQRNQLQQLLPFTVLKLSIWIAYDPGCVFVATALTVYGIETSYRILDTMHSCS